MEDPPGNPYDNKVTITYPPRSANLPTKRLGGAIHDDRLHGKALLGTRYTVGSHHQKILCVKANGELIAFCGGVDFNRDRLEMNSGKDNGAPLHDVHCEVRGPGACSLLRTFVDRWHDHPESKQMDTAHGKLVVQDDDLDPAKAKTTGRQTVQLGRTFGKSELFGSNSNNSSHAFAPQGEQTGRKLLMNAIRHAKKFIYLEDQYFVNEEAGELLGKTLLENKLAHITIVVPHHKLCDMPIGTRHRRSVIKKLRAADPKRVRIFYRMTAGGKEPGGWQTYVHAKTTIIDDEFAVIGSMNYNRRSWTHDSEALVGISDPSSDQVLTSRFAHWLRIKLWAEHLFGLPPDRDDDKIYAELFDGVAAGALWERLIQLKREWWEKKYPKDPIPPWEKNPGGTAPPHDRDYGYDQADQLQEPLATSALVRPYDEDDDPYDPHTGNPILVDTAWNDWIDPQG